MYTDMVQLNSVCDYVLGLSRPTTIVDVGAHHGLYAVTLGALSGPGGRVLAIEPEPRSFSILSHNVVLNGLQQTIICEQAAASDVSGAMTIVPNGSQSHLASAGGIPVRVFTLSELLRIHNIDAVDLLMIDVEGAELQVLRGFPWEIVPVTRIMCEMHPNDWHSFGCDPAAMAAFLSEHDLDCLDMYFHWWEEFDTTSYIGPCLLQSTKAQSY
jgi:FkbM family methyltransferase